MREYRLGNGFTIKFDHKRKMVILDKPRYTTTVYFSNDGLNMLPICFERLMEIVYEPPFSAISVDDNIITIGLEFYGSKCKITEAILYGIFDALSEKEKRFDNYYYSNAYDIVKREV